MARACLLLAAIKLCTTILTEKNKVGDTYFVLNNEYKRHTPSEQTRFQWTKAPNIYTRQEHNISRK